MIGSANRIQIETQPIRIGMETTPHEFTIEQPRGIQDIQQIPADLSIRQPRGELEIDHTRALDALGYVDTLTLSMRISAEARRLYLEGLSRTAQEGDRLAALHQGGNPIADIAWERFSHDAPMNLVGEASYDPVDVYYTARPAEIDVQVRGAETRYEPQFPRYTFTRGKLDIYVEQYPSVKITPPRVDITV